jgi:hypothetical protein
MRSTLLCCAALVLLPLGCAVKPEEIRDSELHSRGLWTDQDEHVRGLMRAEPKPAYEWREDDSEPSLRLTPIERKLTNVYQVGSHEIPVPSLSKCGETLLGMRWDPRYHYLAGAKAYVFLKEGEAPFVVPEDPEAPDPRVKDPEVPDLVRRLAESVGPKIQLPSPQPGDVAKR